MIVNDNDRHVEVTASGSTATFFFDFAILTANDIRGFWNGVEQFGFTVTGAGADAGGSVTFGSIPVAGTVVALVGGQPYTAPTRYTTVETLPLTQIENDFARMAVLAQQLHEMLDRVPMFPIGSQFRGTSFSTPVPGQYLRYKDAQGNIESSQVVTVAGSISVPIPLAQGGTGVVAASNSALAQSLGLARWGSGSALTAATNLALLNPLTGNFFSINGSSSISSISTTGVAEGTIITLRALNAPTFVHSASLQMIGASNYVASPNETLAFQLVGTNWIELGRSGGGVMTGTVLMFAGSTAPGGYLLCDGGAYSRTTYANLFAWLGTTYGIGDGSTTFNVPNFKGRIAVGRDAGQAEFATLGQTGGEKTHTLTVAEMPAHDHFVNDAGHAHLYGSVFNTAGTGVGGGSYLQAGTYATTAASAGITLNNTGGGGAHNNLQPYVTVNYIIKT